MLGDAVEALLGRLPGTPLTPQQSLRLGEQLRAEHPPDVVAAAMTLRELRVAARAKFRLADRMLFTRDGLEQATSEVVARHRGARFAGRGAGAVVDLCCGIGGDLIVLAQDRPALAVDRDPGHVVMAMRNAELYGATDVQGVSADVRDLALPAGAAVFVDPARRTAGRRLRAGDSEPPLAWCLALADGRPVAIKAAPGLPLGLVPQGWEVEFVAVGRELKEAVLWSPAFAAGPRTATVLAAGGAAASMGAGDDPVTPVAAPGAFLIDPNPAVTRAGLVGELAAGLGAWKIDEQAAFLSADAPVGTPFGRTLEVLADLPWSLKRLRAALRALDVGEVHVRKRGSAVDVEDLRRRLRLDGSRTATVVLTRVADRPWAFVVR